MLLPSSILTFLLLPGIKAALIKVEYIDNTSKLNDGLEITSTRTTTGIVYIMLFTLLTMAVVVLLTILLYFCLRRRIRHSEEELIREEENQAYLELNSDEQELYFQSKEFLLMNPYFRNEMTLSQNLLIQEKGIKAYEFQKDPMLTNSDLMILNKTELNFFKKFECSSLTNLPIPMKNDVYYFECKIFSLPNPEETIISFGIGIKPYPWFRLPGRHLYSISYDSTGFRRHNQPFGFKDEPPFPKCIEGDVIGIGYRVRSGTVFFTRNGKKINEAKIGGHIKNFKIPHNGQIYPIIGANNLSSIHVNIGQMGYVFIEGNVKKWGFAALEGNGPAPPAYNKFNADILLERSEVDDDNDLSDRESDFPPDFWEANAIGGDSSDSIEQDKYSYNAYGEANSDDERITLETIIPPIKPPSYNSESDGNHSVTDNDNGVTDNDNGIADNDDANNDDANNDDADNDDADNDDADNDDADNDDVNNDDVDDDVYNDADNREVHNGEADIDVDNSCGKHDYESNEHCSARPHISPLLLGSSANDTDEVFETVLETTFGSHYQSHDPEAEDENRIEQPITSSPPLDESSIFATFEDESSNNSLSNVV